jgi:hypothetical protein
MSQDARATEPTNWPAGINPAARLEGVFKPLLRRFFSKENAILCAAVAFLVWCLVRSTWFAPLMSFGAPAIVADDPVFDFQTLPTGDSLTHAFQIRNAGWRDLEISQVISTCGCAVPELTEKVIRPGQSVPVEVKLSLKALRGPVEKAVVVASNDPARPNLVLTIRGVARSEITVKPLVVDFGKVAPGEPLTGLVEFEANGSGPFTLQEVVCDSPLVEVKRETLKEGQAYRLRLRTTGKLPEGSWRASLRVRTDHAKESEIVVPLLAQVEAKPATVSGE